MSLSQKKETYLVSFAEVNRGRNAAWVLHSEQTIKPECIKPPFQFFLTYVTALEYWKDIFSSSDACSSAASPTQFVQLPLNHSLSGLFLSRCIDSFDLSGDSQ